MNENDKSNPLPPGQNSDVEKPAAGSSRRWPLADHREQFLDSMLDALFENSRDRSQQLVSSGLDRIGSETDTHVELALRDPDTKTTNRFRRIRWPALGVAAAVLILLAIAVPHFDRSRSANAALNRCIEQAVADVGRHYEVRIRLVESGGNTTTREADLYVRGGDQLAVRTKGPLGFRDVWMGIDGEDAWFVPPLGPYRTGNRDDLAEWMQETDVLETPYLHVSSLLQRMQKYYELSKLPDAVLHTPDGIVGCIRISGTATDSTPNHYPRRIDVWADSDSGVAMKVLADWELADDARGKAWISIDYVSEKELDDEFFRYEAHTRRGP